MSWRDKIENFLSKLRPPSAAKRTDNQNQPMHELMENEKTGQDEVAHYDEMPAVDRSTRRNRVAKLLGFVFIAVLAVVFLKPPSSKNLDEKPIVIDKNSITAMPELLVPAAPTPAPVPLTTVQPRPNSLPASNLAPLPANNTASTVNQAAPPHWSERKKEGMLLISSAASGHASGAAYQAEREEPNARNALSDSLQATALPGAASASHIANRDLLITRGKMLDCTLDQAINTTFPGLVTCTLAHDVYSDSGRVLLMERGTKIEGEFSRAILRGEARIFLLFNRAITPEPHNVAIDIRSAATDALGRTGMETSVDNHFWERFGAAILTSVLSDSAQYLVQNRGDGTYIYGSAASGGEKIVEEMLRQYSQVQPTGKNNQGESFQIMVARDLDFSKVYKLK